MKVFIVINYARPDAVEGAHALDDWLSERGVETKWSHDKKLHPGVSEDPSDCDLVVSLGGDGTLLRAARIVGYSEIPIIGISYGHLGFLTSASPENLLETVGDALAGELHASRRATLEIESEFVRPDGTSHTERGFALNDFALSRSDSGDMVMFDVSVSGNHIDTLRGDGFVVASATGSTGYALAAGGPIVTPEFTGMVCVPVAPHTILARAFLTAPSDVVEISMSDQRPAPSRFFADGQSLHVHPDDQPVRATIRRGPGDVILLDHSARTFYGSVSRVFYGRVGK
ncbi:MAG: NAD(+)/NADH kinase [Atopobiaceae bacterium]|nr:NAD(+)/NADH kinase [Atopobiaceae bacterium]MCI1318354.1 NAD(+)/NADH kinase [Atopobiaceae bacterium]MCI1388255.1 NAD(+)/NADH kinase [Atopobiaceae bacterium]MCI1431495.1 NAD(+)/NADH kinase [Atopobiaceae bacterium]MCI1469931.1 NAD(+)/NADH kinase [Atopobiaceae bacterium]